MPGLNIDGTYFCHECLDVGVSLVCFWFEVATVVSLEHCRLLNRVVLNLLVMTLLIGHMR